MYLDIGLQILKFMTSLHVSHREAILGWIQRLHKSLTSLQHFLSLMGDALLRSENDTSAHPESVFPLFSQWTYLKTSLQINYYM